MNRLEMLKNAHRSVLKSIKDDEHEDKLILVQPHNTEESSLSYSNISRFERLEKDY